LFRYIEFFAQVLYVPQDFSIQMLKDSISSPVKVLDIHRLNRRIKTDNEIKYTPSRTVCIKFSGQSLPQYIYLYNCRYAVSPYVPKARICFKCFKVGHVSKSCKGKSRCIYCGKDKHDSTEICSRLRAPYNCINCAGNHLATSHLCPEVIKHKMIFSMASTNNISFSEAKKSIYPQSQNSPSSHFTDPQIRLSELSQPFQIAIRPVPSTFETFNKFSILQNYMNSSPRSSPPDSFASPARRNRDFLGINNNYNKNNFSQHANHGAPLNGHATSHRLTQPLPTHNIINKTLPHRILSLVIIMIY